MPNPFLRFKKRAYFELAAAVCIIALVVIVLCVFTKGKTKSNLQTETFGTSAASVQTSSEESEQSSESSVKNSSTESSESASSSDSTKTNGSQDSSGTKSTKKTTKKTTTDKSVTEWTHKNSSNNVSTTASYPIDNFQKHMISGLTADQLTVLNQILEGIENFETDISIKSDVFKKDDLDSLKSLFVLVKIACLENSSVASTYKYAGNSEYITAVKLTYTKTKQKAASETNQLNQKVDSVLKGITSDMNEFERVEYLHDAVNKLCVYGESSTGNQDSAFGCLVEGKAICEGYAKAFLLLCNKAGIDSTIVTGTAVSDSGESASHMWNMIMVGGAWYHIDLTWDDLTLNPADKNYVRYDFFNLTDSEIAKTHTAEKNQFYDYPKAYSTKYNYFVYHNYCGSDYTSAYKAMKRAVTDAVTNGSKYASIRLNSSKTFTKVKKKLFEEANGETPIFTLLKSVKEKTKAKFSTSSVSKIFMEQTGVITVVLK